MNKFALAALLGCAFSAHAMTGEELYAWMREPGDSPKSMASGAYVMGLMSGLVYAEYMDEQRHLPPSVCPPATLKTVEAWGLIKDYLAGHPERRSLDAGAIGMAVFKSAWPCK